MLPAHYNPKMSSPPNPWLEDVTGSSMAKCDNLNPHYNVMTSLSPSASSLNVSQQNWDRQFQLYFNGIYNVSHIITYPSKELCSKMDGSRRIGHVTPMMMPRPCPFTFRLLRSFFKSQKFFIMEK